MRGYYSLALWFPFIIPLLIVPILALLDLPKSLEVYGYLIIGSGVLVGVQYLLFATIIKSWWFKKDRNFIRLHSFLLPVYFLPISVLSLTVLFMLLDGHIREVAKYMLMFTKFTLLIGYGYVVFAHVMGFTLKKLKLIHD